ncbi:MAG: SemiSWEET transporter [Marivibrio sp.]|uniref:SemiSWEET transporter n=1 Tax=Marivibrio sp. TaxID=2039719 RepID=UPI0032EB2AEC
MATGAELPGIVQAIGLAAGALTTLAFLPQVVKTWRTRSTADISLWMFLAFLTGVGLWLAYGLLIGDAPLIAANGATFLLAGVILYFKLRHG